MLLTVHGVPEPKVASHHEVEAAVRARVALRVAVVVVGDAYSQRAVEEGGRQPPGRRTASVRHRRSAYRTTAAEPFRNEAVFMRE